MIPYPDFGGRNFELSVIDKKYNIHHWPHRHSSRLDHGWYLQAWGSQCCMVYYSVYHHHQSDSSAFNVLAAVIYETECRYAA